MKTPKILVVRTDRLGDVLLSTPVLKNLKSRFPQCHISFMCRPYTKDAVDGNPYIDEVIVYDKYDVHKSMFSSFRFAWELRKKKFDFVFLLHPTTRAHFISFIAGIPVRVGWAKKSPFLLTRKIPHTKHKGQKHEVEYTLDILSAFNIPIKDTSLFFPLKEKSESEVEELLRSHNISGTDKFIVIHPSASCPSKRWSAVNFSLLIKQIKEKTNPVIAVISSADESCYGERIINDHSDVLDLRGKLDVSGVGALLKRADLFISNDSGPVHIAAAVKTPVISLFGRNDPGLSPRRWAPLGENSFYIHKDVGCKKCRAHNCEKDFLCLKSITPEEVCTLACKIITK